MWRDEGLTPATLGFSSTLATAYNSTGSVVASTSDEQAFPTTDQTDTLTGAGITSVVFSYNGGFNGPAITNLSSNKLQCPPHLSPALGLL